MATSWMVESPPALPGQALDRRGGLKVLIVEDNADSASSEAMLLRILGHEVEVAQDGPAALAMAERHAPDVVLLDIGLPGIDGWALAKLLQDQAVDKKPFIIAVTGFGRNDDVRHSAEAGIDLHLVKPVDPQYLEAVLRRFQRVIG
jgi:two-component system, OmpR family, response regulator